MSGPDAPSPKGPAGDAPEGAPPGAVAYSFSPAPGDGDGPEPRPAWGGRLLLSVLGLLLVLNVSWMVKNCQKLTPVSKRGTLAPDFTVPRLGGGSFKLSESRGHPVLLDFWATWCGPCKESLPILDRVYARYKDRGLVAIAIETEASEAGARAFMDRLGLKLPVGLGDPEVSALYQVTTIPHLVLIDSKGQVVRVFHGVHGAAELSSAVEEAGL